MRTRRVVVAVAEPERSAFFPRPVRYALEGLCEPDFRSPGALEDPQVYLKAMRDAEIVVTSWGFPTLDRKRLDLCPSLRLVVHSGSSVRFLVTDAVWDAGLTVTQAGDAMSPAVAEISLAFTMALLRRLPRLDHGLREGRDWFDVRASATRGREIHGTAIGVIGASRTGRRYIDACRALGAKVRIFDPYVATDDPLSPLLVPLDTVLRESEVIALHAPLTDETRGMLGAAEIDLMRKGALVVNTARSAIMDMDALYAAAEAGRIDVAIDVFDEEPLPTEDRWRNLENALLTPHVGGATAESRARAGAMIVDEIRRYFEGEGPARPVDPARLEILG